jgi:hypothetical protein
MAAETFPEFSERTRSFFADASVFPNILYQTPTCGSAERRYVNLLDIPATGTQYLANVGGSSVVAGEWTIQYVYDREGWLPGSASPQQHTILVKNPKWNDMLANGKWIGEANALMYWKGLLYVLITPYVNHRGTFDVVRPVQRDAQSQLMDLFLRAMPRQ